ncbi:c-type cytochrome [Salisaeta longa]|uniref:c-type cytochrome n=1 Tax=Salisaeta longa TaxID=503170 RepID=UPI0003B6FAA8|nr:cytochrome c [Salisaeta longa]
MHRLPLLLVLSLVVLAGCRGMQSEEPPVHPNLNMDIQQSFKPQEANPFFANNMAMRKPVPGTIARGLREANAPYHTGRTAAGQYVERVPFPVTKALVRRGQERYEIYCTVCHGGAGNGNGVIMTGDYGYTPAPTYHSERLRNVPDGYIYDVIANGVRNMPGYAQQIPVRDRWAIVTYIRALQQSQNATESELPASALAQIEQGGSANIDGQAGASAP